MTSDPGSTEFGSTEPGTTESADSGQPPVVVVLGSVNVDFVVRSSHLPAPGETVTGGQFFQAPGGKGANQAVAAARCAGVPDSSVARVQFLGAVGEDVQGSAAVRALETDGIDCRDLKISATAATGIALILVDEAGENLISVASGANADFLPADVQQAATVLKQATVLLCQLETPLETVETALRMARDSHVLTILNPAPVPAAPLPASLWPLVDILTPNRGELARLTAESCHTEAELRTAAETLQRAGCGTVVVTCGKEGAWLLHGSRWEHIPPVPVHAVDTTAAGDAFSGALATRLAEGAELSHALEFAAAAAALAVQQPGAQPSLPRRVEVEQLLSSRK